MILKEVIVLFGLFTAQCKQDKVFGLNYGFQNGKNANSKSIKSLAKIILNQFIMICIYSIFNGFG
jgi:hypothetical protein